MESLIALNAIELNFSTSCIGFCYFHRLEYLISCYFHFSYSFSLFLFLQMVTFQVIGLTKQVDMTERQIERWWRYRRAQDKPSTLVKFCENSWRFLYYTHSFAFGLFVLWDKSWFWDIKHCWYGYPHQVSPLLFNSKGY